MASVKNLRNHVRYPSNASACYVILPDSTLSNPIQTYSYLVSHDSINYVVLPCNLYFDVIPKMRKNNEKIITMLKIQFCHWFASKNKFISGVGNANSALVLTILSSLEFDICSISTRMFYAMFDDSFFLFFDLEFKTFERVSERIIRKSTISVQINLSSDICETPLPIPYESYAYIPLPPTYLHTNKYDSLRMRILKTPT